ncbi:MAG: hypothetical protein JSV44_12775 [Candidatus Zixiibacteriota bacterium]|nr:MAG: hypothetical protein JSV44_12775 [candidate division Zixibacteria bacterium]
MKTHRIVKIVSLVIISGVQMSCSQSDTGPEKLLYVFSGGPSLCKEYSLITISDSPRWTDAQVPPPEDFDWSALTVLISPEDFESIWAQIRHTDFGALKQPGDDDFEMTPPDVNHTEQFRLVIDDSIIVAWSHGSGYLKRELRQPLDTLAVLLREIFDRRLADPVVPESLAMRLKRTQGGKTVSVELIKEGERVSVAFSDLPEKKYLAESRFRDFIRELLRLRIFGKVFESPLLEQEGATDTAECSMILTINGITVVDFTLSGRFEGRETFDRVMKTVEGFRDL